MPALPLDITLGEPGGGAGYQAGAKAVGGHPGRIDAGERRPPLHDQRHRFRGQGSPHLAVAVDRSLSCNDREECSLTRWPVLVDVR